VNLAKTRAKIAERLAASVVEWNRTMPADNGATYAALNKASIRSQPQKRQR
jgi:hypothetical protein